MTSKKTPSNKRLVNLNNSKIKRIILVQSLQLKSLQRENEYLRKKIETMRAAHKGPYKYFYKLAYACEVIFRIVRKPFRRKEK